MEFQLTKIQKMTRRAMREFVRQEVVPLAQALDETSEFPSANYQQAFGLGIMDMALPESMGGLGEDFLGFIIALDEFAYGNAALAHSISVTEAALHLLYQYGTQKQQQRFIARLHAGEILAALPTEVSDADGRSTGSLRAEFDENGYRLNGSLLQVAHAPIADIAIVFALTANGTPSAFIVDRQMTGFKATRHDALMGMRSFPMGRLKLNDVHVTHDDLLGAEGNGGAIYGELLRRSETAIGAIAVGISQAALEEAVRHCKARVQFGKPLAKMQATQNKIADMAAGVEAARLLVYQAAFYLGQRSQLTTQTAIAKIIASDQAVAATQEAVQIHGGYGYMKDYTVERLYRDAVFTQIYPTTNATQRSNIAQATYRTIR